MRSPAPFLFCDLDGVLADFDAQHEKHFGIRPSKDQDNVDWTAVRAVPDFFASMPLMAEARELWAFLATRGPQAAILTGVPYSIPDAAQQKRRWVETHFGLGVLVLTCPSRLKSTHCVPGAILVDDREKYRDRWEQAGGIWVTYASPAQVREDVTAILSSTRRVE